MDPEENVRFVHFVHFPLMLTARQEDLSWILARISGSVRIRQDPYPLIESRIHRHFGQGSIDKDPQGSVRISRFP